MFWTQAAGLTQLGRTHAEAATESTLPAAVPTIVIARRRTRVRRITRTQTGRNDQLLAAARLVGQGSADQVLSAASPPG